MMRTAIFARVLFYTSLPVYCLAQQVVPVIHLSPEEAAATRQAEQHLRDARSRSTKAYQAWKAFLQTLQAEHPDMPNLKITSDFRFVYIFRNRPAWAPQQISPVPLTAEEQHRGRADYREMNESRRALFEAEHKWKDYQHQFLAKHVRGTGGGLSVTLPDGKQFVIPPPWGDGKIAFTPNFRFAVPVS